MKHAYINKLQGFTLIEMIIAIVVLAAGVTGIFAAFSQNAATSADPLIKQQAIIIAQGYLEEAMLKPYSDPNGAEDENIGCAGSRVQYDDVADYDCISDTAGAVDQFGNTFAGLGAYNVDVSVTTVNIGAPAVATRQVVVTVTHDAVTSLSVTMTGFRAPYY